MADLRRLGRRTADAHLRKRRLQRRHALDMIGMMMRQQNVGECPAAPREGGENRLFVWGVDRRRRPADGIMDKDADIIGEAEELFDVETHEAPSLSCRAR